MDFYKHAFTELIFEICKLDGALTTEWEAGDAPIRHLLDRLENFEKEVTHYRLCVHRLMIHYARLDAENGYTYPGDDSLPF